MGSSVESNTHAKNNHEVEDNNENMVGEEESFCYAMQLVLSSTLPMSMQSAIELGVFDIIAKAGPGAKLSAFEIAADIGTKNPEAPAMLDRILHLLTTHSVLSCSVVSAKDNDNDLSMSPIQRLYGLNRVSNYFVINEDGVSLGPLMSLVQDKVYTDSWCQLKGAVVEGGIPFNRVHGVNTFEYPDLEPRFNHVFNKAMLNQTTIVVNKILDLYKGLHDLTQLVDVGGGVGATLNLITSRHPHIKGINFDLPHVIKHAPSYPGVEHVGGDMLASVPSGDAVFMKCILHDWSDEHCLKLLKNCYNAIPENGKVIVVEALVPITLETSASAKSTSELDVFMLTQTIGGKERTQQEFMALATGAGFSGIRFECFVCNCCVMEFFK